MDKALLSVKNLSKSFVSGSRLLGNAQSVRAVDDVSFDIRQGETFGLVGESGCGKSTIARTIMRLYTPDTGSIVFDGTDIAGLKEKDLRAHRLKMQMIFQDPYASLDPRMNVLRIIEEPLLTAGNVSAPERRERVERILEKVGLSKAHLNKYPHEFSGGQRQRIGIARAMVTNPKLVLCDEPISALDVSIQAQIVNMLRDLQAEFGLTYLFIAHDLSMVRYISRRMGVMYLGKLMEVAPSGEIYRKPLHPYTQGLILAIPVADPRQAAGREEVAMEGEIPSPINPPSGCRFHTRCRYVMDICPKVVPEFREAMPGHHVACHLY